MRVIKSILLSFMLFATAMSAQAGKLVNLKADCTSDEVRILVGGFGDDWRHFEPWLEELKASSSCLYGFSHDHRGATMSQGARSLAEQMQVMQVAGFQKITVLAHSMGGLVAKRALHDLAQLSADQIPNVELKAFGTPWGGFFWANFARWVPGSQTVASWMGFPMSAEIGTTSDFMKSLQQPLPSSMSLVIYNSLSDEVTRPQSDSAKSQFQRVALQAKNVFLVADIGHSEFVHKMRVPL